MVKLPYIVFRSSGYFGNYDLSYTDSDPYDDDDVRSDDQRLHRALSEIVGQRSLTGDQIKRLVRTPDNKHNNSMLELVMERDRGLREVRLKSYELRSLLWIAVLSCYQNSAELLVRSGADVNELYGSYRSSLMLTEKATILHALLKMYPSAWNERIIGLVMDHGADLQARESDRSTHLHLAVKYGRVKVAETLLEKGADVNAVDAARCTPLLHAAFYGQAQDELLPLLMAYGADINARDIGGQNFLRYLACAPKEYVDLARILIEKGISPREVVDSNQFQPIHVAVAKGHNQLVNLFLDHGANVNARERAFDGKFPLYIAVQKCENPSMLLTLLKRGANIDMKTNSGYTALHGFGSVYDNCDRASVESQAEKMKILLSAGADMFAEDNRGLRPFDAMAIGYEYVKYVPILLKELALRKARLRPSIEFKDERILNEKHPALWDRYQGCVDEIDRIKSTKFIKSGAFFDLLTKCQCQLVELMRNREFKNKFKLFDRSVFPLYTEDILEAFERSEKYYESMLDQENLINEAFYNALPHLVVRKVVDYIFVNNCEICEMKEIVQASRGT